MDGLPLASGLRELGEPEHALLCVLCHSTPPRGYVLLPQSPAQAWAHSAYVWK